jgi:hypothetical protein
LGWVSLYEAYEQEKKKQALDRLSLTMENAFWDAFRDSLYQQDYSLLEKTIVEVRDLIFEIPHPFLSNRGRTYLEDLFHGLEGKNAWSEITADRARGLFLALLGYLRECDSVAFEEAYNASMRDLETTAVKDVPELVSKGFQSVYALLIQLRAKMQMILDQNGSEIHLSKVPQVP